MSPGAIRTFGITNSLPLNASRFHQIQRGLDFKKAKALVTMRRQRFLKAAPAGVLRIASAGWTPEKSMHPHSIGSSRHQAWAVRRV